MDWGGWAVFGLVATLVLTAIMVASQLAGLSRMDLPFLLGAMFVEDPDRARVIGALIHIVNGYVFALMYAASFALLGESSWWLGALFGAVHGVIAISLIIPLLPGIHPRMASERRGPAPGKVLEPPGPLALNYGRETPVFTIAAHIIYGGILGGFIGSG